MTRKVRVIAELVVPLYRKKSLSQNALNFDDLTLYARELLIFKEDVRTKLHQRWTYILADEFQDTSLAQLDLIKLLITQSLLIVGDGDQCIYSWKGAYAESTPDFVDDIIIVGGKPMEYLEMIRKHFPIREMGEFQ